ncbi:MAG: CDGSH iron-sulfur domain-containing protein [Verrucomicrobiota bacterium]
MDFPQLIEDDFQRIDAALKELMAKTEANHVLLVEKAGHLIQQCGGQDQYPPDVLATLASNSFNAVQFMAGLLNEDKFPGMYQQGERFSTLMLNVDEHCILMVIFGAHLSVGAVRFYASKTTKVLADQIAIAEKRGTNICFDLTDLNVTDVQGLFGRKPQPVEPTSEASAPSFEPPVVPTPTPEPPAVPVMEALEPALASEPAEPAAPVVASRGPYVDQMMPGVYYWCSCGRSQSQPYCDGSHQGTGLAPKTFEIFNPRRVTWCGCKHTKNPPFCDGTHSTLDS